MDTYLKRLGDAYHKYAINPCEENFKILQEITGRDDIQDVFDATQAFVDETTALPALKELETSVNRLHNERSLLLQDRRISQQAQRQLNPHTPLEVNQHLQALRESIGNRIRQLTRDDASQRRLQSQLFGLCCRRFQEKIRSKEASLLGPQAYELVENEEFQQDAKALNQMSQMTDPTEKLSFFDDHVNTLQDKYLPGKVLHERLCQLLIITIIQADNPNLPQDIEAVDQILTPKQRNSNVGQLIKAALVALYMIQQEALPDLRRPAEDSQNAA